MPWYERDYYGGPGGIGGPGRGGLGGGGGFGGQWSMVMWLLVINAVVFLLDTVLRGSARGNPIAPSYFGAFTVQDAVYELQIWRFVTYQFLHAGLFHILFNMLILYFFGPLMESWWGSRRFLAFYLLCGASGAVLFTLFVVFPQGMVPVTPKSALVGASGSIFGILIGCAVKYPNQQVMLLIPPIPMRLRTLAFGLLGLAFLSILAGSRNAGGEVAHLGGAGLGYLLLTRPRWLDWVDRLPQWAPSPQELGRRVEQVRRNREQRRSQAEEEEVDRILRKVKEKGLHHLTPREKKTLQEATDRRQKGGR